MNPYLRAARKLPALRASAQERLNARRNPIPPRPEQATANGNPLPQARAPQPTRPKR